MLGENLLEVPENEVIHSNSNEALEPSQNYGDVALCPTLEKRQASCAAGVTACRQKTGPVNRPNSLEPRLDSGVPLPHQRRVGVTLRMERR